MIIIRKATKESRKRDTKRKRFLLIIGQRILHTNETELSILRRRLNTLLG